MQAGGAGGKSVEMRGAVEEVGKGRGCGSDHATCGRCVRARVRAKLPTNALPISNVQDHETLV
eukprot:354873-Chlamydomonas_euryale.AAC.4